MTLDNVSDHDGLPPAEPAALYNWCALHSLRVIDDESFWRIQPVDDEAESYENTHTFWKTRSLEYIIEISKSRWEL